MAGDTLKEFAAKPMAAPAAKTKGVAEHLLAALRSAGSKLHGSSKSLLSGTGEFLAKHRTPLAAGITAPLALASLYAINKDRREQ
jgi:hypothetical protein